MNEQVKAILLAHGKQLAIQILDATGHALLKAAAELEDKKLLSEPQNLKLM